MSSKNTQFSEFQYIVEKVKPQPICFGSGLHRDTDPLGKGLSSYQKRFAFEVNPRVTPATYDYDHLTSCVQLIGNKVRSKKGVAGLVSGTARWSDKILMRVPSPTRYTIEPSKKTFKKSFVPFNQKLGKQYKIMSQTPGKKSCRHTRVDYNFGCPKLVPAVEIECNPMPRNKCDRCGEICRDDYWCKNSTFLCHLCMEEEKVLREDFTISQLKKYKKIRICSYKHNHEGVQAYRQLWTDQMLKKRDRKENYLNLYLSSYD